MEFFPIRFHSVSHCVGVSEQPLELGAQSAAPSFPEVMFWPWRNDTVCGKNSEVESEVQDLGSTVQLLNLKQPLRNSLTRKMEVLQLTVPMYRSHLGCQAQRRSKVRFITAEIEFNVCCTGFAVVMV